MRILALLAVGALAAACTPPATQPAQQAQSEWDMGPMPPVAALYDAAAPPATLDERDYYFTKDLATALSAANSPVNFDYRSWANDPQILGQTFGLSETPPDNRAEVVTRFTYPGVGGGMIVTYTLCRMGPSQWSIENVSGQPVSDAPVELPETPPSLRQMLNLPATSPACD
ncbi:MAG: hypothetical protein SGJ23_13800 [Alphaproteobacteria bacterium]|nr:hypothetical protein [Alphaproteobacteria bacterium]